MMHSAFVTYLTIGAAIGLVVAFANTKQAPAFVYAMTMLVLIVFWPAFLLLGAILHMRKRQSQ